MIFFNPDKTLFRTNWHRTTHTYDMFSSLILGYGLLSWNRIGKVRIPPHPTPCQRRTTATSEYGACVLVCTTCNSHWKARQQAFKQDLLSRHSDRFTIFLFFQDPVQLFVQSDCFLFSLFKVHLNCSSTFYHQAPPSERYSYKRGNTWSNSRRLYPIHARLNSLFKTRESPPVFISTHSSPHLPFPPFLPPLLLRGW